MPSLLPEPWPAAFDTAGQQLAAAGITGVDVILTDGALGHPEAAPFDRVIATVGTFEVPTAWLEQLAPGGRLVVPVRLAGAASRSIIVERDGDGWVSRGSEMAVFMPLRGIGDDKRRVIDLTGTGEVTLQTHKDNANATDADILAGDRTDQRRRGHHTHDDRRDEHTRPAGQAKMNAR